MGVKDIQGVAKERHEPQEINVAKEHSNSVSAEVLPRKWMRRAVKTASNERLSRETPKPRSPDSYRDGKSSCIRLTTWHKCLNNIYFLHIWITHLHLRFIVIFNSVVREIFTFFWICYYRILTKFESKAQLSRNWWWDTYLNYLQSRTWWWDTYLNYLQWHRGTSNPFTLKSR